MNAKLTIQRNPLHDKQWWYWSVTLENGNVFDVSNECYQYSGLALIDASENGKRALIAAESAI